MNENNTVKVKSGEKVLSSKETKAFFSNMKKLIKTNENMVYEFKNNGGIISKETIAKIKCLIIKLGS